MTHHPASRVCRAAGLAAFAIPIAVTTACAPLLAQPAASARRWIAGDHHVHSEFSAAYSIADSVNGGVPTPVLGQDGRYSIVLNVQMAKHHGLGWMVSTDHGGPNHSKLNHDEAYPAVQRARRAVPEVVLFYGMEFDTPAADHSSLILPHTHAERSTLLAIESRFAKRDAYPRDPARDTEPFMLGALSFMRSFPAPPVLIANHPSRSATGIGVYGQDTPAEFRAWNDTAPNVAVGMEGAPGHQANAIAPDGTIDSSGARGGYRNEPTRGGFDQMTAIVGGLWDAMLGEGRRWVVTSTSDSHRNWRDGGSDFWPGEYSKTYVFADATHDDILDGIRHGRVFVTTGDLVAAVDVRLTPVGTAGPGAAIGDRLEVRAGTDVAVTIRVRDPDAPNHHRDRPAVARVDLIVGEITGPSADRANDRNPTTRVAHRFTAADWQRDGEDLVMRHVLRDVRRDQYVRVRGTNTQELEPAPDPRGEDPWTDLWFYVNPVFVHVH